LDEKEDEMKQGSVLPKGALLERITITYVVDGKRKYSRCNLLPAFDTDELATGDYLEVIYRVTKEAKV